MLVAASLGRAAVPRQPALRRGARSTGSRQHRRTPAARPACFAEAPKPSDGKPGAESVEVQFRLTRR